ncbi:MAG: hypothetical protein R2720_03610 [Candidatus Nanopelagicales bacterium]
MRITGTATAVGAAVLFSLTACGGGGDAADTQTTTAAASPTATEAATTDTEQGCDFTDNTGTSSNKELQAFAVAQYESIDCSSDTDVTEQLRALTKSAQFKQEVADQGWTADTGEALGGVSVAIIDVKSRSGCTISAIDSPARGKTVDCQDV